MSRERRLYDQFLLMLSLSQIRDIREVRRIFQEALSDMYPGLRCDLRLEPATAVGGGARAEGEGWVHPVATIRRSFGALVITGSDRTPDVDAELRNLVGMLAVILENRHQTAELETLNRRLHDAAAQNRDVLTHMTRALPVVLYIYDLAEGRFVYTSAAWFSFEHVVQEDREALTAHFAVMRGIPSSDSRSVEYRLRDPGGRLRWYLGLDSPYARREDGTNLIVGAAIDITDRKAIEEQKDTLLREVNHRVKNNLAVVSGLLFLQAQDSGDERVSAAIKNSRGRLDAMALIHEHLYEHDDLSSVEIKPYLTRLFEQIREAALRPGIVLELRSNTPALELAMDEAVACGLIVNELISNALEHAFTDRTTGRIVVTVDADAESGITRLEVADSGRGFDVGFDAAPGESGSLGFKLVRHLAAQIGLGVRVESNEGGGTRVVMQEGQAVATVGAAGIGAAVSDPALSDVGTDGVANPRVFVVEDEHILVLSLERWAARHGIEIVGHAGSGVEAIALVEKLHEQPDIIVTDIRIRGRMDGIETARELQGRVDSLFLFQTGFSAEDAERRISEAGIRRYRLVSKQRLEEALLDLIGNS